MFCGNLMAKWNERTVGTKPDKEPMNSKPTNKTAAIAGIFTSLGVLPFVPWSGVAAYSPGLMTWLIVAAVFVFLPTIYFVIGKDGRKFGRNWISDPLERARYFALVTRVIIWAATAAVSCTQLLFILARL
jgi:hypothetical protein